MSGRGANAPPARLGDVGGDPAIDIETGPPAKGLKSAITRRGEVELARGAAAGAGPDGNGTGLPYADE